MNIPGFQIVIFLLLIAFFGMQNARADSCNTNYEEIFAMLEPEFGSYTVWDKTFGTVDYQEKFTSAYLQEDGKLMVVGERAFYIGGNIDLMFAEADKRGRILWDKYHNFSDLVQVKKILKNPKGYIVLGNAEKRASDYIWLGFFDQKGEFLSEKAIAEPDAKLTAEDIIAHHNDTGYIVLANSERNGFSGGNGVIYIIDFDGNFIEKRSYVPGSDSRLLSISKNGAKNYTATGYIMADDGRRLGWALRLDENYSIVWQRQYPRGRSAIIKAAHGYIQDHVILAGEATPSFRTQGNKAAWVMAVNNGSGQIAWQRYYTGELNYSADQILVSKDHIISILLNGDAIEDTKYSDFSRIMTINPRGALFLSDEYFHGLGMRIHQLIFGHSNERVMVGETDVDHFVESADPDVPDEHIKSLEGILMAGDATDPYDDPCRGR